MKLWNIWYYTTLPFRGLVIFIIMLFIGPGDDYYPYPSDEELALFATDSDMEDG